MFFSSLSLCNYYFYLNDLILSCLPRTWWKFPLSGLLYCVCVCVDMCVCVGFPLRGHSLSPCVILVSRFHGCCDIPTPVERITLRQCVCLCAGVCMFVCMWTCLMLKDCHFLGLFLIYEWMSLFFCLVTLNRMYKKSLNSALFRSYPSFALIFLNLWGQCYTSWYFGASNE